MNLAKSSLRREKRHNMRREIKDIEIINKDMQKLENIKVNLNLIIDTLTKLKDLSDMTTQELIVQKQRHIKLKRT